MFKGAWTVVVIRVICQTVSSKFLKFKLSRHCLDNKHIKKLGRKIPEDLKAHKKSVKQIEKEERKKLKSGDNKDE